MEGTQSVTILFTDLVGSTQLTASLAPEAADALRHRHFSALRQAVASCGGMEVKNLGDGLMVVFPSTSAGLACAVAMQQNVEQQNRVAGQALGLRVGLSVGEVTCEDDDYFGEPVIEAARLCAAAEGGQILISDVVKSMAGRRSPHRFSTVGDLELKGLPDPVATLEVEWDPAEASPAVASTIPLPARLELRPSMGLIGRDTELARLWDAFKGAADGGSRQVVLLSGEAGMGKTTLAGQLARQAAEAGATVLFGHCEEDYGAHYGPLSEALSHYVSHATEDALRQHVELHGGELGRMVPALRQRLGELPPAQSTDPETERYLLYNAVRGVVAQIADEAPLVLVLDDIQWASKPSMQLLAHLVANTTALRLLVWTSPAKPDTGSCSLLALRGLLEFHW